MTQTTTIRLDKSKPFSECRGERTPDDPHYRVQFWQGSRVGKKIVLLPFDAEGHLVPDDGKKENWNGVNVENKPVLHHPLYDEDMRALLKRKIERLAETTNETAEQPIDEDIGGAPDAADHVNLESWLRGEARYQPHELRAAAKKRFSKNYGKIGELVVDLVLDEQIVPEDQVCAELAEHLPKTKAA